MSTDQLAEFEEIASRGRSQRRPCKVAAARAALTDDEQRAQLDAALATSTAHIPTGAIVKWFERRGLDDVPIAAVTTHRQKRCQCHE